MWDELDVWHSSLAALEVDVQDLEKPEEMLLLTERLVEVQQLHSQLAKQAEQRTTLLSKVREPPSLPVSDDFLPVRYVLGFGTSDDLTGFTSNSRLPVRLQISLTPSVNLRSEAPPLEENRQTCWMRCGRGAFVGSRCSDAAHCLCCCLCFCSDSYVASGTRGDDQQLQQLDVRGSVVAVCSLQLHHGKVSEQPRPRSAGEPPLGAGRRWSAPLAGFTDISVDKKLQTVLDDSAQIRTTLQGFGSVLKEMSQVCDITALQEQLVEADRRVATVQESFTAPLSQLEHAAAVSRPSLNSCIDVASHRLMEFCQ